MLGEFLFAFVAGAIATANPCGFALLPAYLARRLGAEDADSDSGYDGIILAIGVGVVTTAGFLLVFGLAGAAISLGAYWLTKALPWAGFVIGVILTLTGLATIIGRRVSIRMPSVGMIGAGGWRGDLIFGVGYGTASLSCTLPIFLMVTGTAMTGGLATSAFSFLAYALGMGAVLMALAVAATLARHGLASGIKGIGPYLRYISGILLLLAGVYITYYWGNALFSSDPIAENRIIETGEIWSSNVINAMDSPEGGTFLIVIALTLVALFSWALARRLLAGKTSEGETGKSRRVS